MANTTGYTRLAPAVRELTLAAARRQAVRAADRYARLLAAEAGIAARIVYPDLARLVFRITDDVTGPSATLVAAYSVAGRQLWHIDTNIEWPDETQVSDYLAAAADWSADHFEPAGTDEAYVLDLDR